MFDISFSELMVVGVIALIVIGPERLPKVARTLGHLLGRAQRYVNDVKTDIKREIELDELRKFKEQMQDAAQDVQTSLHDAGAALKAPADALRSELDALNAPAAAADSPAAPDSEPPADPHPDDPAQPSLFDDPAPTPSAPAAQSSTGTQT